MKIRDLITDLLDYDMDHEVVAKINFDGEYEETDFNIDDNHRLKEIYLEIDLTSYKLVETDRVNELEEIEEEYRDLLAKE